MSNNLYRSKERNLKCVKSLFRLVQEGKLKPIDSNWLSQYLQITSESAQSLINEVSNI